MLIEILNLSTIVCLHHFLIPQKLCKWTLLLNPYKNVLSTFFWNLSTILVYTILRSPYNSLATLCLRSLYNSLFTLYLCTLLQCLVYTIFGFILNTSLSLFLACSTIVHLQCLWVLLRYFAYSNISTFYPLSISYNPCCGKILSKRSPLH